MARVQAARWTSALDSQLNSLARPTPALARAIRRGVPPADGGPPAADQIRHVLARLLGAQEGDVRRLTQAQPCPYPRLLVLAGHVERLVVDAVVGHVDPGRVGVEQPDQLVTGRLAGHDDPGRTAQRGLDRAAEEGAP